MRHQIRIFAAAAALALCIGMAAPAQAWPGGDHSATPAAGWWQTAVDALATLFGLDRPAASLKGPKRGDGSALPPQPALQLDNSCGIDPAGNTVCHPGS